MKLAIRKRTVLTAAVGIPLATVVIHVIAMLIFSPLGLDMPPPIPREIMVTTWTIGFAILFLIWIVAIMSIFASLATLLFTSRMGVVAFVNWSGNPFRWLLWRELSEKIDGALRSAGEKLDKVK
jgi:hypothetical protein